MKRVNLGSLVLLAFALAPPSANQAQSRQVLEPSDNCTDHSATAIVTFSDSDLEEVVRAALSVGVDEDLTCGKVAKLTQLRVPSEIERVVYGGTLRPSPEKPFESLEGIQNLSKLTTLAIMNRLLTDIRPLSELTNLRFLNLHTNWISDIRPLSGLSNLEQLIISENPIADISAVRGLTKLTRLQVHGLYPYQLQHFLAYDDGRDPNVVFNGITDISPLAGLTELRYLRIHLHNISDISPLDGLTNLTHLRIYDNNITNISPLRGLTKLKLLWAHNNEISDISALGGMTELLQLGLANNRITDISALDGLASLEHLFLEDNSITDIGPLGKLQNTVVLHLDNNAITDVSPLQNLSNLRELGLADNDALYDVQPLLANDGIGRGDEIDLRFTYVRCSDMDTFESRGVTLLRATALNGSACGRRRLEDP